MQNAIAHQHPPGAGGGNGVVVTQAPPSTALVVAESNVGSLLEEKLIESHQVLLKKFTGQSAKFIETMSEHQLTFLQSFTTAQAEQAITLQRTLAEQNRIARKEQQAAIEEQRAAVELRRAAIEEQRMFHKRQQLSQEETLEEQRFVRTEVRSLLTVKRERSFTLELNERTLQGLQNDPAYTVRRHHDINEEYSRSVAVSYLQSFPLGALYSAT